MRALLFATVALSMAGCGGAIDSTYVLRGYDIHTPGVVKRIVVAAWAPTAYSGVDSLAADVASDLVRVRKNYLVRDPVTLKRDFGEACEAAEGVLTLRVLDIVVEGDDVALTLEASLYRCEDGALLWRTSGKTRAESNDNDLQSLAEVYANRAGAVGKRFAAPLFVLLQQLLVSLPDPVLTEDEIAEKIELG